MRKIILLCSFCLLFANVFAQANSDSVAYQRQRQKINDMLAVRSQKFGQYDKSLSEHTGIFGFQTKKDIRRSNDILMDIVKTDDNIYKELKILLEYRAFQQRQIQSHSKEAETINQNYINLISKLRQQNAVLKASAQKADTMQYVYILIIVLMIASILFLISKKSKVKV